MKSCLRTLNGLVFNLFYDLTLKKHFYKIHKSNHFILKYGSLYKALDAHVSKHVFSNVIGPKSILEHSTRILVTNALHLLPQVNRIYVIDDGRIVETGTFQQAG